MREDDKYGYPPVSDHFKLLATSAILVGTHPVDVFDAVTALTDILGQGTWREARFNQKAAVT